MRRPRSFRFDQLSEAAKQAAREAYTGEGYLDHDWWEHVFSDAVECAKLLGITIYDSGARTKSGKSLEQPDIHFSGFWSQGDGASFTGKYETAENPMAILEHAPKDKELHRIAAALCALQVAARMEEEDELTADITQSRRGFNLSVDVRAMDQDGNDKGEPKPEEVEGVKNAMRDFATWIYRQLEQEHEYLHSDEVVDEALKEHRFDKEGALL